MAIETESSALRAQTVEQLWEGAGGLVRVMQAAVSVLRTDNEDFARRGDVLFEDAREMHKRVEQLAEDIENDKHTEWKGRH